MAYIPQYLDRWTTNGPTGFDSAANYMGADMSEYYIAIATTRDADVLARSNWEVVTAELEAAAGDEYDSGVHRFGHWACGWYELFLIHPDDEQCLRSADEWAAALGDYPVADDVHFSEMEYQEAAESWRCLDMRGRLEMLDAAGVSIFAARRDYPPMDDAGYIQQQLLGY